VPVVSFRKGDLEKLLGVDMGNEELVKALNRLKGELEEIRGDEVTMEVTHDRPDLFSVEGMARALRGLLEIELGLPRFSITHGDFALVVNHVPHRPYIMMSIVRDVELDDEAIRQMIQLQEKIHLTYGRDRRKLAIGFYDADKMKPPLTYGLEPIKSVKYTPLGEEGPMDGEDVLKLTEKGRLYGMYALRDGMVPVIRDSEGRPLVIVPVLGSEEFKVDESTRRILIDVTSVDMRLCANVLRVVTHNLLERSRSRIVESIAVEAPWGSLRTPDLAPTRIRLSVDFINDHLGMELSEEDAAKYLLMSRHGVEAGDGLIVDVAPYRINVLHPVDLVEDVAVAMGYDRVPREEPRQRVSGSRHPLENMATLVRDIMVGMGFQEVLNYMLTSKESMSITEEALIEVDNPRSELYSVVRSHIWPQLLGIASRNKSSVAGGLRIFEVGDVVVLSGNRLLEDRILSYLITGPGVTLTNGLAVNRSLMGKLNVDHRLVECKVPGGLLGRVGCMVSGEVRLGFVMEVSPDVITRFNLDQPAVVSEVSITGLMGMTK
jgi:phenylalanyl-tRNA synthetase beta chain